MDDSSDDDLEIGPQKSAEELLRERERLAEARGDVVDVGADDADAAMPPPVAVKPEKVKPERKPHLAYEDEAMGPTTRSRSTRPSRRGRSCFRARSGRPRRPRPSRPS